MRRYGLIYHQWNTMFNLSCRFCLATFTHFSILAKFRHPITKGSLQPVFWHCAFSYIPDSLLVQAFSFVIATKTFHFLTFRSNVISYAPHCGKLGCSEIAIKVFGQWLPFLDNAKLVFHHSTVSAGEKKCIWIASHQLLDISLLSATYLFVTKKCNCKSAVDPNSKITAWECQQFNKQEVHFE